jgi:hypothetical protein
MSRIVTVAATQMACSWDLEANIETAEKRVREAAAKGAQIILIQELFEAPYFCQKPNPDYLQLATTVEDNVAIKHFQKVAKELQVVLPISFYELAGRARFNSIAIIDADGSNLGMALATTKSTTSTRAIPASKSGTPVTRKSAWASAGISGSLSAPAAWRCKARKSCSTRPPSAASHTTRRFRLATIGSACNKAMRAPI